MGERLFGRAGGTVLALGVAVSVLGSLAAVMLVSPRVYVALARDGLFPARIARLHPRFGTPATAIALQAALAILLVAVGTFADIVAYFVFVTVAFIAASVAGLYRLPAAAGAFRHPAAPFHAQLSSSVSPCCSWRSCSRESRPRPCSASAWSRWARPSTPGSAGAACWASGNVTGCRRARGDALEAGYESGLHPRR